MDSQGRNAVARRLAAYLKYRERKYYMPTLEFLAREMGVSERTVRRDLDALEDAGITFPEWRVIARWSKAA